MPVIGDTMMIRRAVPEDNEAIDELYSELEKDSVYYQPEHFIMSGKGAHDIRDILDSSDQVMIVAVKDGRTVGFAHAVILTAKDIPCLKKQKNVYIRDLVVSAAERSKGTGTALMEEVKRFGRDNGAEFVRTQVFPMNTDGLRFYHKNGFTEKMITIECPL